MSERNPPAATYIPFGHFAVPLAFSPTVTELFFVAAAATAIAAAASTRPSRAAIVRRLGPRGALTGATPAVAARRRDHGAQLAERLRELAGDDPHLVRLALR